MITCADIAKRIAGEFFVPVAALRLGRGGETVDRAREAYALAVQCLTAAPDVSAAAAIGLKPYHIDRLRRQGHETTRANPVFAHRVEEIVRAMLRESERLTTESDRAACLNLGAAVDRAAERAEEALVEAALRDGPIRDQLELETLIAIDPDAACFAATAHGLRALAARLPPESKGKAQDYRRMATRLEHLAKESA